uniref:Uncharacterized protein n=1 Tax=Arundo donax TaxID=35708 RepID=A0A0A8Z2Z7_ARUDO
MRGRFLRGDGERSRPRASSSPPWPQQATAAVTGWIRRRLGAPALPWPAREVGGSGWARGY